MDKMKVPIVIVIMGIFIVGISGCTDSKSNTTTSSNINDDFYIDGEPLIQQAKLEDGNIIGGDYAGEWRVTLSVRSKSGSAYNNVTANVTAYDKDNNIIYTKIKTIPYLPKGLGESLDFSTGKKEPDHVTMVVLNATRE